MKRRFRLSRSSDFTRVRRVGKSYAHPLLVLVAHPNQTQDIRLGFTAGRSLGGAVQRNRAKRLLRAAIKPFLSKISPGHDLVLIARKPILSNKSTEVEKAVEKKLRQAKLV